MEDLNAFRAENAVYVKILDVQRSADFPRSVVAHTGTTGAIAAVRNVELVPVAPWTALLHFCAFVIDPAGTEIPLDEIRDRAVLYKGCKNLRFHAEIGRYGDHIRFRARRLHEERVRGLYRLPVHGTNPYSHARRHHNGVFAVFT